MAGQAQGIQGPTSRLLIPHNNDNDDNPYVLCLTDSEGTMAQGKRRISYVIPPPPDPDSVSRLRLPPHGTSRLGAIGPLLVPLVGQNDPAELSHHHSHSHPYSHSRRPRHRLGVASLALDTSTQLVGKSCSEGILYTGGRDGLVISWDLGISTKRRAQRSYGPERAKAGIWEVLTGWADNVIDEEGEDDDVRLGGGDGDVLGDVNYPRRQSLGNAGKLPYEQQWEMDSAATKPGAVCPFILSTPMRILNYSL
jgi:WD repeat-containing protein 48